MFTSYQTYRLLKSMLIQKLRWKVPTNNTGKIKEWAEGWRWLAVCVVDKWGRALILPSLKKIIDLMLNVFWMKKTLTAEERGVGFIGMLASYLKVYFSPKEGQWARPWRNQRTNYRFLMCGASQWLTSFLTPFVKFPPPFGFTSAGQLKKKEFGNSIN